MATFIAGASKLARFLPHGVRTRLRRLRASLAIPPDPDQASVAHKALRLSHSQLSGFDLILVPREPHRPADSLTASFYDRQHEDADYRRNNWLLEELPALGLPRPWTIIEVGCGNGHFLRAAAPQVTRMIGVDWATSPELRNLPGNVEVVKGNVAADPIPSGDLVCSADVLEHFSPLDLDAVVAKLVNAGQYQHHVIACYDDGHSHLSVLPPAAWLALFRKHCQNAYLADVRYRRDDPAQIVCVISNLPGTTKTTKGTKSTK